MRRTLDQVIYAYEQCSGKDWREGCGRCAYQKVKHGACKVRRNDDALHYLKEYRMQLDDIVAKRKKLESEIDRYQEAVRNCEEAENKYKMLSGKLEGFPTADIRKILRY